MKRTFSILAVVAGILATTLVAQSVYEGRLIRSVFGAKSAVDTDVALVLRYVGSSPSVDDTVTVESDGNLTFKQDAAADTTLECPVSGALGGIIDVSDAACDTWGEVVDIINASADWEAILVDSLRTDSSNDTGLAAAAADATLIEGLQVLLDSSSSLVVSTAVTDCRTFDCFAPAGSRSGSPVGQRILDNPYLGTYTALQSLVATTTYGSGTSTITVYGVVPTRGGETVTTLWSSAGGATTAAETLDGTDWPNGLVGPRDAKIIVRVTNSAALTAATQNAYGLLFRY